MSIYNDKNIKVLYNSLKVESYDRWEDTGGHDGGPMPSGPWYPEDVSGYVILNIRDKELTTALDDKEPDCLSDFAGEICVTGDRLDEYVYCKSFEHFKFAEGIYLFIPIEMAYEDCEVGVNNPSDDNVLNEAKKFLVEKGLI